MRRWLLARYLIREMTVPFLIGQAAIVLLLTGSVLYNNAQVFLQFQVPVIYVVRIAFYFIPFLVHMTMPVAMAVGSSLAISRMSRDSEITVMRASGISLIRIFLPIFVLGFAISIFDFYFGEWIVPASIVRYEQTLGELITHISSIAPPAGGAVVSLDQRYVIGVRAMVQKQGYIELYGIEINSNVAVNGSQRPFIAVAKQGEFRNGVWTLYNPFVINYDLDHPDSPLFSAPPLVRYTIPVDPQAFQSSFLLQMPMGQLASSSTLSFSQIGEQLKKDREMHIQNNSLLLDYYFKLSIPFSCLVMALCCPPMALKFGKTGGFGGTLVAICLVFVYWNTLLLARILGTQGPQGNPAILPPLAAAWSQNIIFSIFGIFMTRRSE